ncbi:unnamed protein product [Thlaspi arvense]|uniref:Crossover junction endonuclease MUS81 n=1 Tax=Thlaspi arvense TaxID=13288 RepID=A0AAU9SZT5_THLAR|nr:unnamed protein product [Thlaspi arvense]
MLKITKGYFDTEVQALNKKRKKAKGRKRYIPQRNSVAYALLITLHRGTANGKEYMGKQELIDAADASGLSHAPVAEEEQQYTDPRSRAESAIPSDILEKFTPFGYSKEQVVAAFKEVSDGSQDKDPSTLWLSVMCHLRQAEVYNPCSDSRNRTKDPAGPSRAQTCQIDLEGSHAKKFRSCNDGTALRPCSSALFVPHWLQKLLSDRTEGVTNIPYLPPLTFGEAFEESYQVILILDDREQFATKGSRSRKIVDNICSEFKIKIERSGFKKLIYIIEGDPNHSDVAESIKTACFTTEILEGFDVMRTSGLGETLRKYGCLTKSIHQYYKSRVNDEQSKVSASYHSFDSFVKRCQDLDKMTISDVFAIQLMQVPQVTEEIAIAVLDMYPTLLSLASAYSHLCCVCPFDHCLFTNSAITDSKKAKTK